MTLRLPGGPPLGFKPAPTSRSPAASLSPSILNTFFQPKFKIMFLRAPDGDRGRDRGRGNRGASRGRGRGDRGALRDGADRGGLRGRGSRSRGRGVVVGAGPAIVEAGGAIFEADPAAVEAPTVVEAGGDVVEAGSYPLLTQAFPTLSSGRTGLLPAEHIEAIGVKRRKYGNAGRVIKLRSNHVEVKLDQGMLYHYDGMYLLYSWEDK
jgi:hypothetical protein